MDGVQVHSVLGGAVVSTDVALLFAFMEVESAIRSDAYAPDKNGGSFGLLQIDLPTAKDAGFTGLASQLKDPFTNIKVAWFGKMAQNAANLRSKGQFSVEALAAAWNEGLRAEELGRADPVYINRIVAAYARWKILFPVDGANVG